MNLNNIRRAQYYFLWAKIWQMMIIIFASNWEKIVFFFKSRFVTKFQNKTSFCPNFQELTKNIEGSSIFLTFIILLALP